MKKKNKKSKKKLKKPARSAHKKGTRKAASSAKKVSTKSAAGSNIKLIAAGVCNSLADAGFDPVLTGKACAVIYGGTKPKDGPIDFVISEYISDEIEAIMKKNGFVSIGNRSFSSKKVPFEVNFLPPPMCVGDSVVEKIDTLKTPNGYLRLLNPTDAVRQRLAYYARFGEKDALEEAVRIARRYKVDMPLIERWSHWEWSAEKYDEFVKMLGEKR